MKRIMHLLSLVLLMAVVSIEVSVCQDFLPDRSRALAYYTTVAKKYYANTNETVKSVYMTPIVKDGVANFNGIGQFGIRYYILQDIEVADYTWFVGTCYASGNLQPAEIDFEVTFGESVYLSDEPLLESILFDDLYVIDTGINTSGSWVFYGYAISIDVL